MSRKQISPIKNPRLILGGMTPLLVLLVSLFTLTNRSRDPCKIDLEGNFSDIGLSLWVEQELRDTEYYFGHDHSISVGQYGCTIILEGNVPDLSIKQELEKITKRTQVVIDGNQYIPVKEVENKIEIQSDLN